MRITVKTATVITVVALLYGCGTDRASGPSGASSPNGGSGPPNPSPLPPNLAGVWAGTWSGFHPEQGWVTGTWEGDLVQSVSAISGAVTFRGDIDCMDGFLTGSVPVTGFTEGDVSRYPCALNTWRLWALDLDRQTAFGMWGVPNNTRQGQFFGRQVAKAGGPRILFVNPPSGSTNSLVTIAGTNLGALPDDNALSFNGSSAATLTAGATALTVRVPEGASTGPVRLTTPQHLAISPADFSLDVAFPEPLAGTTVTGVPNPGGVAISPDGRKAYVTGKLGSVSLINTANGNVRLGFDVTRSATYSVVAGPDGRWVYMTAGSAGISVIDAATAAVKDVIPIMVDGVAVNAGEGPTLNPQGLAISTDGRHLFASDNQDGGTVVMVDIATKSAIAGFSLGPGWMPLGIAVHPDGRRAYFAFTDTASHEGVVRVFDTVAMTPMGTSISVGAHPTGVAVTRDGAKVYVSNNLGDSVSVIDSSTNLLTTTIPVGLGPAGLAVSPDNSRVYVVNNRGNTVSVIGVSSDTILGGLIAVGTGPQSIAISPDGRLAYVTNAGDGTVTELGGSFTLTVAFGGDGRGAVTSYPSGIACGTNGTICQARFAANTLVFLNVAAESDSHFASFREAYCGGSQGRITVDASRTCTANIWSNSPWVGSGSGGGCFIATAAYGSSLAEEVVALRRFRDDYLLKSGAGREFVRLYYRYSPDVADYIRERDSLRAATRLSLWPLVFAVKHPTTSFCAVLGLGLLLIRIKRVNRSGNNPGQPRGKRV